MPDRQTILRATPRTTADAGRLLRIAWRYTLAILLVAVATVLTRRTQPVLGEISPLFFVAVMLSSWFGGMGPGLLATVLAGWASAFYFWNIPEGTGAFGWDDALRLVVFLICALLISFLLNMRRRAERSLRIANDNLETRVIERTRALEASNRIVRESEEGFRALIEGVTDCAICMLDPSGKIVQWNSGAQRIQGYTETEVLHCGFDLFFAINDKNTGEPAAELANAAASGRYQAERWRVRKDGSAFLANIIITPLLDENGKLRGFAHVARDITELKRLEREVLEISEREQRRIGQDLHDGLGQELTGLTFLSQNLARKLAERNIPEAADLRRMSELINKAIEKARDLAKGLSPVEWGPDGLAAALQNLSTRVADSYGIPCEFRRGRTVQVESHTAAVHLYRIAQEAVSNAARHSGAHRIWTSIDAEGSTVVLTVEDDGKGMPPRNGTNASSPQATSVGMGLHLMPYRARMIGAHFEIGPRPGGGTTVRCRYESSSRWAV
jgi:two-component system CheB/CheR fusion protein